MKNIVLIGFMGTGKTSIGKLLAMRWGMRFVDSDQLVEENEGRAIADIFATNGEDYFRVREKEVIRRLSDGQNMVVSTGGGVVKDKENISALASTGIIIALTANVDTILARTGNKKTRPLLNDKGERREIIERLLAERSKLYEQADFSLDTSERSPLELVDIISQKLKDYNMRKK